MNSDTVRPMPPRCFSRRRKETSVTPAIGESTNGGLISMSRILKGLISFIKKPHEILPHVALVSMFERGSSPTVREGVETFSNKPSLTVGLLPRLTLPIHDQSLGMFPSRRVQAQRRALQTLRIFQ